MPWGFSNLTPISAEFQLQYEQARIQGPEGTGAPPAPSADSSEGSGADSRDCTARGPMQMGHWKQLRVHLDTGEKGARVVVKLASPIGRC